MSPRQTDKHMLLSEVMAICPATRELFAMHGLEELVSEENMRAIAPFVTLETALQTHGIAVERFLSMLEEASRSNDTALDVPGFTEGGRCAETLMALMPCGLKVPFSRDLAAFMNSLQGIGKAGIGCSVESNLNHEVSYYPYVSHLESIDELPDIVISSDFNSFYHSRFYDRFVRPGHFANITDCKPSALFADAGIPDPEGIYTMLCVNPLIIVADLQSLNGRALPQRWSDLLDPVWEKSITLRGSDQFFCHAVLVPFYKEHGASAMSALARNVLDGRHPSQMVKTAGSGRSAALYVMPDFFSRKIPSNRAVKRIWPEEGALASPVTMLVKRESAHKLKGVTDYLTGRDLAKVFAGAAFPTPRDDVECDLPGSAGLKWPGWDYIRSNDLETINAEIDSIFLPLVQQRALL